MTDLPCIQLLVCQQAEVVRLCPAPGVSLQALELLAAAALQRHQPCADSIMMWSGDQAPHLATQQFCQPRRRKACRALRQSHAQHTGQATPHFLSEAQTASRPHLPVWWQPHWTACRLLAQSCRQSALLWLCQCLLLLGARPAS